MKNFVFLLGFASLVSGCVVTRTPVINQINLSDSDFTKADQMKRGEDCATFYLIFGPFGSQSLRNAARNGKISRVKAIDQENSTYIVMSKSCLVAYGE